MFQLPTTCFAEENGSLVNSARWLQWHWKAADPPGEAQSDIWIMSGLFHRLRELYRKEGGAFPDPILNLTWDFTNFVDPDPEEIASDIRRAHEVIVDDAAWLFIVHDLNPRAMTKHVKGFVSAQSWFQDFTRVYME